MASPSPRRNPLNLVLLSCTTTLLLFTIVLAGYLWQRKQTALQLLEHEQSVCTCCSEKAGVHAQK